MACKDERASARARAWRDRRARPEETDREGKGRDEGADETAPHRLVGKVVTHLLLKERDGLVRSAKRLKELGLLTSIANRTPPMGDPKATATPAALEAVRISLILAVSRRRIC